MKFMRPLCLSVASMCSMVGHAALVLTLDDHRDYARYGQTISYVVTLTNTGTATAADVAVAATLSPAWDGAGASWVCYPGTDGATCTASGSGPLDDIATLPPGARASWVLGVPVRAATDETTATLGIGATGATPLEDTDTLVIFKEGFDVPYGDGTQGVPESVRVLESGN